MSRITGRGVAIVALILILGGAVAAGMIITIEMAASSHNTRAADAAMDARNSSVAAEVSSERAQAATSRAAASSADDRYFAELDQMGVPYAQARKDLIVEDAHYYCNSLTGGTSYADLVAKTTDLAGIQKISAAIDVYCPQFKSQLR